MSKNILNDIISSRRKTPSFRRPSYEDVDEADVESDGAHIKNKNRRGFLKWAAGIALAVIFFGFGFSLIFSGASVNITPRAEPFSFDDILNAKKHTLSSPTGLSFDVLEITEVASQEVESTGVEYVEEKASGTIIVFNEYSANPQKLIINTRFEAPDGNIYRIKQPITIPGTTKSQGKIVPGAIEVIVYADQPGESYNIGLVDFSVPGLKGTPQYSGIYARSKTPMEGGEVGERKQISQADRERAIRQLRTALSEKLSKRVFDEKPEGFIIYDDGIFLDFSDTSSVEEKSAKDTVLVILKGVARAVMFSEKELSEAIANNVINNFDHRIVSVPELNAFRFTLLDKSVLNIKESESVSFSLSGSGRIVWVIDKNEVRKSLTSQPKKEFQKILASFLNIERAAIVIRPFWNRSFPDKEDKIIIDISIPEVVKNN